MRSILYHKDVPYGNLFTDEHEFVKALKNEWKTAPCLVNDPETIELLKEMPIDEPEPIEPEEKESEEKEILVTTGWLNDSPRPFVSPQFPKSLKGRAKGKKKGK